MHSLFLDLRLLSTNGCEVDHIGGRVIINIVEARGNVAWVDEGKEYIGIDVCIMRFV